MNKAKQLILPISYPDSGRWYAPVRKIKIDERTYALRMGEPVQLGTVKEIEKEFRVGRRVLARLADIGVIERVRPSPFQSMYYFADIAAFLETIAYAMRFMIEAFRQGEAWNLAKLGLTLAFQESVNFLWRVLMGVFEAIPRFLVNGFKTGIMVLDILTDAEFWKNVGLAFLNVMQAAIAGIAALLSKLVAKIMDLIPGLEEQARWMHGLSDDARRRASVGVDNVGNAGQRLIDAYGDRILDRISDDFSALQDAFSSGFSEAADVLDTSGVRAEISAASEKITASLAAQDKERAAKEKEDASKSKPRRQKTEDDAPKIKVNWETVLAGSLAKVGGGGYGRMMLSAENVPQKQLAEQKKTNELLNKLLQKQNGLAVLG